MNKLSPAEQSRAEGLAASMISATPTNTDSISPPYRLAEKSPNI